MKRFTELGNCRILVDLDRNLKSQKDFRFQSQHLQVASPFGRGLFHQPEAIFAQMKIALAKQFGMTDGMERFAH